jgi:putative two-component system response regulator
MAATPKTVLVVDDDPVFVDAISAVLETRYTVARAANGTEARAAVAARAPDLIILDVMMDHPSEGFDVARDLHADPVTRAIPVVMLTGVDQVYNYRMETDEGWVPCARFLEKPITPGQLLAHVNELIG